MANRIEPFSFSNIHIMQMRTDVKMYEPLRCWQYLRWFVHTAQHRRIKLSDRIPSANQLLYFQWTLSYACRIISKSTVIYCNRLTSYKRRWHCNRKSYSIWWFLSLCRWRGMRLCGADFPFGRRSNNNLTLSIYSVSEPTISEGVIECKQNHLGSEFSISKRNIHHHHLVVGGS